MFPGRKFTFFQTNDIGKYKWYIIQLKTICEKLYIALPEFLFSYINFMQIMYI